MFEPFNYCIQVCDDLGVPSEHEIVEICETDVSFCRLTNEFGVAEFEILGDRPRWLLVNGCTVLNQIRHSNMVIFKINNS